MGLAYLTKAIARRKQSAPEYTEEVMDSDRIQEGQYSSQGAQGSPERDGKAASQQAQIMIVNRVIIGF